VVTLADIPFLLRKLVLKCFWWTSDYSGPAVVLCLFPLSISAHWWVQLHISPSFEGPDRLNVQQIISNYSVFTCVLHFWVAFLSLFVGVMRLLQICVNKSLITEIWLCKRVPRVVETRSQLRQRTKHCKMLVQLYLRLLKGWKLL
jgi:hypothetical protein